MPRGPLCRRSPPPAAGPALALGQLLAAYLAALLLLQALAAAWALGAGPLHRHQAHSNPVAAVGLAHPPHVHTDAQRHHHADDDDNGVQLEATDQEAAETARQALTAAFALMAAQTPQAGLEANSHALPAERNGCWSSVAPLPLYRPPRPA